MGKVMDDFSLLGVTAASSEKDIKRAWRVLVKAHHPDLAKDPRAATERLSEINAAYDRIRSGKPHTESAPQRPAQPQPSQRPQARPSARGTNSSNFDFSAFRDILRKREEAKDSARTAQPGARPSAARHDARAQPTSAEGPRPQPSSKTSVNSSARPDAEHPFATRANPGLSRDERIAAAAYAKTMRDLAGKPQQTRRRELDMTL